MRRWHAHELFSAFPWLDVELGLGSANSSSELAETDSLLSLLLPLSCSGLSIEPKDWLLVGFELCFWNTMLQYVLMYSPVPIQ